MITSCNDLVRIDLIVHTHYIDSSCPHLIAYNHLVMYKCVVQTVSASHEPAISLAQLMSTVFFCLQLEKYLLIYARTF